MGSVQIADDGAAARMVISSWGGATRALWSCRPAGQLGDRRQQLTLVAVGPTPTVTGRVDHAPPRGGPRHEHELRAAWDAFSDGGHEATDVSGSNSSRSPRDWKCRSTMSVVTSVNRAGCQEGLRSLVMIADLMPAAR